MRRAFGTVMVILLMALGSATASGGEPNPRSEAQISVAFSGDCTDLAAASSKDISYVEIRFADGVVVKDESTTSPEYAYQGGTVIESVTIKSGTTTQTFTCVAIPPDPGLD